MSLSVAIRHAFPGFRLEAAFEAPPGVTALFGRSGSGKTTVVNAVAGLLRPEAGRIAADGATLFDSDARVFLPPHRRRVGYVFQDARLFPHLTVRQNLGFGRWFAPREAAGPAFGHVVDLLGIGRLLDRRPGRLSGGEKQRVAIGRALLAAPRVLLLDEPLAALDEARRAEILPYLEQLRDDTRIPILFVSHSVAEVARLATTVVAIADGRVERVGPPADLMADPDAFPLMGRQEAGALLDARVVRHAADGLSELSVSGGTLWAANVDAAPGAALRVRIRARDVMLADRPPKGLSALNVLACTVDRIGEGGPIVDVGLICGADRLLARVTRRSLEALGLTVGGSCFAVAKSIAVGRRDLAPAATERIAP